MAKGEAGRRCQKKGVPGNGALGLPAVVGFGLVACVLYGFGAGLRGDIGILLPSLVAHTGLGYQDVSFCIAVMNLVFGAAQPAFGVLASRRSNRFVLLVGVALVAGFSTCGFHMVIIESHLFSQYVSCGIDAALCALAALASSRIGHKR